MKKILICFGMFILFLNPVLAQKITITSTSLNGPSTVEEGRIIPVTFNINIEGLDVVNNPSFGIGTIRFDFDFDEDVFLIESVESNGFSSSAFYNEENISQNKKVRKWFILSEALEHNNCGNGFLYCGNYQVQINFYVKNTKANRTIITFGDIKIEYADIENYQSENDVIVQSYMENKQHTIGIRHKNVTAEPSKSNVIKETEGNASTKPNIPVAKSSSALLKSLSIESYDIEFDKYLLEYTIQISDEINSLKVKAEPEDNKATYKIMGADNLKANGNKVEVEIIAEDGSKKTYTINAKATIGKVEQKTQLKKEQAEKQTKAKINKQFVNYMVYSALGVFVLIVIGFVISKIKNRKLDKMLDQL